MPTYCRGGPLGPTLAALDPAEQSEYRLPVVVRRPQDGSVFDMDLLNVLLRFGTLWNLDCQDSFVEFG